MSPLTEPTRIIFKKDPVLADPYYHNVSLLLHGDGTNGSTTIVDSSPSPKTVTPVGDAQISTAQSKFGGSSIAFDGNGDYLDTERDEDFDFRVGDYTVEGWLYQSVFGTNVLVDTRVFGTGIGLYSSVLNDSKLSLASNTVVIATASIAFSANAWNHFALARSSGVCRGFVNGEIAFTVTDARDLRSTTGSLNCRIANSAAIQTFNGYIDELRITKGVARYTSNFTPPTAPFPEVIG